MTRPTVDQAERWQPGTLAEAAGEWDAAAGQLLARADALARRNRGAWTGTSGAQAWHDLDESATAATHLARAFTAAAVAARDGATVIAAARTVVLTLLAEIRGDGYLVADDGAVRPPDVSPALVRVMGGGDEAVARSLMSARATTWADDLGRALDRLGDADTDAAHDIAEAFDMAVPAAEVTRPAGAWPVDAAGVVAAWPVMSQDRIAEQIAAMTPEQRRVLVDAAPRQVGNTDGVPWEMRVTANRINIADAVLEQRRILDRPAEDKIRDALARGFGPRRDPTDPAAAERLWAMVHADPRWRAAAIAFHDREAVRRSEFYQGLLAEVPDPTGRSSRRVDRQIVAFDPARSSFIELQGDLASATGVGVLVPGLNTTITGSAPNAETARRFVAAGRGKVAMITYLGGPFPTGELAAGIADAADPHYALDMAPRLVAFSEDVNRTVDATGRPIAVTYIGHSYGGSIVGTAERFGLTADRVMYVEAAGAGVGVHDPGDWHNRNPGVTRYAMTAPGDWIQLVQGLPFGPHGADPDDLRGVVHLDAGRRLDGSPMIGPTTHSDVVNEPSDAWRNILGVIVGDRALLRVRR